MSLCVGDGAMATGVATLSESQSIADNGPSARAALAATIERRAAAKLFLIHIQRNRFPYVRLIGGEVTQIGKTRQSDKPQHQQEQQHLQNPAQHSSAFLPLASVPPLFGGLFFIYGIFLEFTPFRTPEFF